MEMFKQGQGDDREWSLDRAGRQEGNGEQANCNNPSIPDFSHQFNNNNNKVKAACITAFF